MPISTSLKDGTESQDVRQLQQWLIALGFPPAKFGADGILGLETLRAYGNFLTARGLREPGDDIPDEVTPSGYEAVEAASSTGVPLPLNYVDQRSKHPHEGRSKSTPYRVWSDITAIVIHQTATLLGETPSRWNNVPIHAGVTRAGKMIQLYEFTEICNHANGLNGRSIGIEIDGWYEGIEGKANTLWQPNPKKPRTAMTFMDVQRDAVRAAVDWIQAVVKANGGKVTHLHPHRQASKERQSDPGSKIWKDIGMWAQDTLDLQDGGADFKLGTGLKIPGAWDPRYPQNAY